MTLILSLVMSLVILFGVAAGPIAEAETQPTAAEAVAAAMERRSQELEKAKAPTVTTFRRTQESAGTETGFAALEYEHYDADRFTALTDELRALADTGDSDGVDALYDEIYDELCYVDALSTYAMIRYYDDVRDVYWSDEYTYTGELLPTVSDAMDGACCYVLSTDCAEAFAAHVGEETADYFRDWEPLTDEQLARSERAMELIDDYYMLYDGAFDLTYSYDGVDWTYNMFSGEEGDELFGRDYDGYYEVYYGLQRTMCEAFAPIYAELVELYKQDAADEGYDSYAEYAYREVFCRDYSMEEAQLLCDAIKPIARAYYADLYYSSINYALDEVLPAMDAEELIAMLGEELPRVDESLLGPWELLTEQRLYDIAPAGSGRFDGGFTTEIPYFGTPYLYFTQSGGCYDVFTVTHEFGHFTNCCFHPLRNALTDRDDLDLCEIHSNGLQALFTMFYDDIFDEGADVAEFANLDFLLCNILDGCIQDEFQRRVFDEKQELTAERLSEIYIEVCEEYGMYGDRYETPSWDANWVFISHNFESPFYYFSYAASAMAALQIWDLAQTDYDAAVDVYLDVLGHDAYEQGYREVLTDCGLRLFTEPDAAENVCRPVLDRLERLDKGYSLSW